MPHLELVEQRVAVVVVHLEFDADVLVPDGDVDLCVEVAVGCAWWPKFPTLEIRNRSDKFLKINCLQFATPPLYRSSFNYGGWTYGTD